MSTHYMSVLHTSTQNQKKKNLHKCVVSMDSHKCVVSMEVYVMSVMRQQRSGTVFKVLCDEMMSFKVLCDETMRIIHLVQ